MTLSTEQQMLIEQRVSNEAKSPGLAYLLWFFLGFLGVHRFYLGSPLIGTLLLVLLWGGLFLSIAGFVPGLVLSVGGGLILLLDLFFIPSVADEYKRKVRQELTDAASFRSLL